LQEIYARIAANPLFWTEKKQKILDLCFATSVSHGHKLLY
jgi:hypothetical protein